MLFRSGERNPNSSDHGHLRYLLSSSKLKFLPESSSGESKIMTGDDPHHEDEGDPKQEYTKKEYLFMYSMVEEMKIEPFPKDPKREKRMIANKFNDLHKRGFTEFDLLSFKKRTENFRLSSVLEKMMKTTSNGCLIS